MNGSDAPLLLAPGEKERGRTREREREKRGEIVEVEKPSFGHGVLVGLDFTRGRDENLVLRMNFSLPCQIGPTKIASSGVFHRANGFFS